MQTRNGGEIQEVITTRRIRIIIPAITVVDQIITVTTTIVITIAVTTTADLVIIILHTILEFTVISLAGIIIHKDITETPTNHVAQTITMGKLGRDTIILHPATATPTIPTMFTHTMEHTTPLNTDRIITTIKDIMDTADTAVVTEITTKLTLA
ncbi:MAG TPA: hypothetical protein VFQ59_00905 [Candidatus Paceibacterota bacterium]|nr:hypothetical protein [Candidatus Paceibacterota bacterium]